MDVDVFGFPIEHPGHATYEDATGTFFISGAGADIWGPIDSFYAVSRALFDNSVLTARVVSEQNTHPFAKAGLIMGGFGTGPQRVILDVKPDGGLEFMARTNEGTSMSFIAGASASFPVWLRLSKSGAQFTGEMSSDGETWTTLDTVMMTQSTAAFVTGFAVTSHDPSVLNTAVFDNVGFSAMGASGTNLLINGGFEDSVVPNVGSGWVSDTRRDSERRVPDDLAGLRHLSGSHGVRSGELWVFHLRACRSPRWPDRRQRQRHANGLHANNIVPGPSWRLPDIFEWVLRERRRRDPGVDVCAGSGGFRCD
jgi:hypothetical protein